MDNGILHSEAVVLHALLFKEYDRILTLFTPQGLLKLFVKIKKGNYLHFAALTSPLTLAEFHYTKGRKDLHRFQEGTVVCQNIRIRNTLASIAASSEMVRAIQLSQWPDKPAPHLYSMFRLFLQHLPEANDPNALATAFLVKTLKHEGVLQLRSPFTAVFRFAGECYEKENAPLGAILFEEEEEALLALLTLCRSLSELDKIVLTEDFKKKIETLFLQAFSNH